MLVSSKYEVCHALIHRTAPGTMQVTEENYKDLCKNVKTAVFQHVEPCSTADMYNI